MIASTPPHLLLGLVFALVVIYYLANHVSRKRLPPSAPSTIPYYDHTRGFLEGGERLYSIMKAHAGSRIPIRFNLPGENVYLISSPELIRTTLYDSKSFFTHHARARFIQNVLGHSKAALQSIQNDTSGSAREPLPGSSTPANKRILRMQQVSTLDVISSTASMAEILRQFTRVYDEMLDESISRGGWVELRDLCGFMRHIGSAAVITAPCGPRLLRDCPGFLDAFWTFDQRVHFLHMALPIWLNPRAGRARAFCIDDVTEWRKGAVDMVKSAPRCIDDDMWNEIWGLKAMRLRNEMYVNFPEMDEYSRSDADLGILWASNDNLVPTIFTYIFAILRSPSLLARCKAEMDQARLPTDQSSGVADFDPLILIKHPLLKSVLNEVLRMKASSLIGRTAREDFHVGDYTIPKGSMALVSAHLEHMNKSLWETQPGAHNHPVEEPQWCGFIPFGLGYNMCPGRHFAVRAVLCTAARFVHRYEVVPQPHACGKWPEPEKNYKTFGYAICAPANVIPVLIRRIG
ncbi:cytochrome P450 [Melanomma pulvis-pyrius CBS 109.77]|uniref:Cytochrome P450 n=1 Tax=Melanomma pulvis-pyrius CBS 109.77 TaxID=1314802 RepID=A0A6A6X247_9PLEO|nr:cytochrome P450 [Melanomma pulvis-pyrius CBS 109.77]